MPPIERAVVPPNQCARSRTITLSPACAATNAHVIPAAPEPNTTPSASINAPSLLPLDGRTHLLLLYFESPQARCSRDTLLQVGRASYWDRVGQSVLLSVVPLYIKK